jgi:putative CocE/NonD family hydrolase
MAPEEFVRPLAQAPGLSVADVAPWWSEWLAHDRRDEYWVQLSPARDYAEYEVPMLHIGGWWDLFGAGTVRNYQGMRAAGKAAQHLWIGPWAHTHYEQEIGALRLGPTASAANAGVIAAFNRFIDQHLRDAEPRLAPVHYFLLGANEWRDADDWPPSATDRRALYLHSGRGANSNRGDGMLSHEPPSGKERRDRYLYDPERPVPSIDPAGPHDRGQVEARDDVLCYTTDPLPQSLTIAGPVVLELWAISDAPDTDWTAMLVDVYPDGRAISLCDGILRARYRESLAEPRLLEPNKPECYTIQLGHIACRFDAGHRIRLEVSSSSFPKYDPNPNTGRPTAFESEIRVAIQQVLHDAACPSRLCVSVLPSG